MINSGIYQIRNKINYHMYIGSAVSLQKRWNLHKHKLRKDLHENKYLQNAWNLYGEKVFEFSEVEFVEKGELIKKEQFYIDLWKPEYNIAKTAGSTLGFLHSEKTKKKISISRSGKHHSQETLQKMSISKIGENHPMYGKKSPEQSIRMLGKKNPNWKEKITLICSECKMEYEVIPCKSEISKFCSNKCRYKHNKGINNPNSKKNKK